LDITLLLLHTMRRKKKGDEPTAANVESDAALFEEAKERPRLSRQRVSAG